MKQDIYVLILANNLASFYDSQEMVEGVPRVPKGAPHLAKGGAALYESLIGANFADLHSLSFRLYNANRNTGYAPSLGQYWPYSGWNDRNECGDHNGARRPRLYTNCQSVPFISCARGSIDSRSLGEYENKRDACTFNMRECTSAAIDPM